MLEHTALSLFSSRLCLASAMPAHESKRSGQTHKSSM